jgi:hypothetical protein
VAPVYNAKPAKLSENTSSVSNKINIQHRYNYILPSIPTSTSTTSSNILPARPASLPATQVTLPEHLDHEAELSEESYEELVQFEDFWHHGSRQSDQLEDIWHRGSRQSDQGADTLSPCSCHSLPMGSCPTFKQKFVDQIVHCRDFNLPNMDGAKIPLLSPSFPADVWRSALGAYFDAKELVAGLLFDDNFNSLLALAVHLGLRLSTIEGHISPPGPVCIALGLQYDVDNNTISLPDDKVVALTTLLEEWLDKPKATEKELASLTGKLLNATNVFAGRLFLNQVLATKRQAFRLKHSIYLEEAFRDDIQWWMEALQIRNGVSVLVHDSTSEISLDASTNGWFDAKPRIGAYNYALIEYISVSPPAHLHDLHISDLEPLARLLVVRVWGPQLDHPQDYP